MQCADADHNNDSEEKPILFEAMYIIWRQKIFIACGLAVFMALVYAVLSMAPRTVTAKGFYQLSRQVKDFAPESAYRENKIVNLQAVLPDKAREGNGQESGGMQNVQGVTIFQPVDRKVANFSWEQSDTEFFITYDVYGFLIRSMANASFIERFLAHDGKKTVDGKTLASVVSAVKNFKPVYAYSEDRKIPNQSYRDAVNYVMGVEIAASGISPDTAVAAAENAGRFLRDRLLYDCLNTYFDSEYRLLKTRSFDLENQSLDLGRKIALLERERSELAVLSAKLPQAGKTESIPPVNVSEGKLAYGNVAARTMALETSLMEARQKADSLAHERKVAAVALSVFEPLKFLSDKTDSGEELQEAFRNAADEFAAKADNDSAAVHVRNRLAMAGRNFDYYFSDIVGFNGSLVAEGPSSRIGIVAAAGFAGFVVLLIVAYLRESFATYMRRRRTGS
ncbi:MAG: hypothetical protein HQK81_00145 [Desulfovibrionaceae bacterium]|nr:hypothetical protein [Desulfovibrionaceae bacterium]MBF0512458.1 hypothetical protein [Desulfovibrionaceae bacterium]